MLLENKKQKQKNAIIKGFIKTKELKNLKN